jgi:hypothetical protein
MDILILLGISFIFNIVAIFYIRKTVKNKNETVNKLSQREETVQNSEKILKEKESFLDESYKSRKETLEEQIRMQTNQLKSEYDIKLKTVTDIVRGKQRKGYYESGFNQTNLAGAKVTMDANIYVIEVDRYTNGKSKIKIDEINYINFKGDTYIFNKTTMDKYVKENFNQLVDTKDIEWLESVDEISKERTKKLERVLNKENENNASV